MSSAQAQVVRERLIQRTRVALVGSYGIGNLGDVALLESAVRLLLGSYSPQEVAVVCPKLSYLRRFLPGVTLIDPERVAVLSGELMVYGGGTQFFAFRTMSLARRLARALASPRRALRSLVRRAARSRWKFDRVACLGVGLGPFLPASPVEEQTKALFRRADFVAVRDRESMRICESWNVPARLRSDLCFLDHSFDSVIRERSPEPGTVAIIVRDWPHSLEGAAYIEPLLEATERLDRQGWRVTFFSFCPGGDQEIVQRLRRERRSVLVWDPERQTPSEFVQQLASYRVVVTARYHGAVFAALLGKGAVCIELEPKLRHAAETLEVTRYLWRHPFSQDQLCRLVGDLDAESEAASERVRGAVSRQRALAAQMHSEFAEFARSEGLRT